jgi:hypothetical protein
MHSASETVNTFKRVVMVMRNVCWRHGARERSMGRPAMRAMIGHVGGDQCVAPP